MRVFGSILLSVFAAAFAVAQPSPSSVQFERATDVETHLPQSSVYEIIEDSRGFLWFATREGLGRWDGYEMRTWRRDPFNEASLPGNVVRQLMEDRSGNLWVWTSRTDRSPTGIARLTGPDHETVQRYGFADARLLLGSDRTPWLVSRDSLYRYVENDDRFHAVRERIVSAEPSTNGGFTAQDGTVFVGLDRGIEVYLPNSDGFDALGEAFFIETAGSPGGFESPTYMPYSIFEEDDDGRIWTGGVGLGYIDIPQRRLIEVPTPRPYIQGYGQGLSVSQIIPTEDDIWLGTLDGVYHYDRSSGAFEKHSLSLAGDIPTQNWVTALHRDRSGTLWAGTVWGLHTALPYAPPFRLIAHNPDDSNSLGSGIVLSVHQDIHNTLWVGTLGGGLNRIDSSGQITRYRHNASNARTLTHDWIWSLESDERFLWIGTGDGLNRIILDSPRQIERLDFAPDSSGLWGPSANGLHLDAQGTLWYGHNGRLNRHFVDGSHHTTPIPNGAGITAIRATGGGAWIATTKGLLRYEIASDTFTKLAHDPNSPESLSDDAAVTLHVDRNGVLWVGTQSGLNRYDSETNTFTHFNSNNGLPSDVIYAIREDGEGQLWISTNRGLARFSSDQPELGFRAYSFADGVGNIEFNTNASFVGTDGTIYFGGDRGVTAFQPNLLHDNPHAPPVVITALHQTRRDGTDTRRYVDEGVVIESDASTFAFEFAALAFTQPHRVRYAVLMDGWDDNWQELGTLRTARYTNLPPGQYTFRVRAANESGLWSEDETAISVIVRPKLWQTWWFRTFLALFLIGCVAFVAWSVSRRRYQRELAQLEARRALEAERSRISRDMHDEVGASLSEIAILSELARRQLNEPNVTEDRLNRIATTSRGMLDSLGQIVWAINPKNDRLPTLIGYLREHAARYLDTAGLKATLQFPSDLPNTALSAEVRRNVFLIQKEALHNIVKHANARTVHISLDVSESILRLEICDDGIGLSNIGGDGASPRFVGGNGLSNMRKRANEIVASLCIEPGENGGTVLQLNVPLPVEA